MLFVITILFAGLFGISGLILDAIGSHALPSWLGSDPTALHLLASWQTAVRTQLLHGVVLIGLAALFERISRFWRFLTLTSFVSGVALFSGSIYLKILLEIPAISKLAPTGGILLMVGWLCLTLGVLFKRPRSP